jgi:hypothetical protein
MFCILARRVNDHSPPSQVRSTERKEGKEISVFLFPVITLALWLLHGALAYVILRLVGRKSSIGQILNIEGMGNLVVGPLLVALDRIRSEDVV